MMTTRSEDCKELCEAVKRLSGYQNFTYKYKKRKDGYPCYIKMKWGKNTYGRPE